MTKDLKRDVSPDGRRGFFRFPEVRVGFTAGIAFLGYVAICAALYESQPSFRSFVADLDFVAEATEGVVSSLRLYEVALPSRGKGDLVVFARHISVTSLAVILSALLYHLLFLRKHLRHYVDWVVAHSRARFAFKSFVSYAIAVLFFLLIDVLAFETTYRASSVLNTRRLSTPTGDNYLSFILWFPLHVSLLTTCVAVTITHAASLFSTRVYESLSGE